eukprot:Selendium_serpulae@DN6067_c0_g1_i8.p1
MLSSSTCEHLSIVCISVCLFVCLPVGLSSCRSVYLSVCLNVCDNDKHFDNDKNGWEKEMMAITELGVEYPQEAYCILTHSTQHKWKYAQRVGGITPKLFEEIESILTNKFLTSILEEELSTDIRRFFALPARFGGLGISEPSSEIMLSFNDSKKQSSYLASRLLNSVDEFSIAEHTSCVKEGRSESVTIKRQMNLMEVDLLLPRFTSLKQRAIKRAIRMETSWLTSIPLEADGFTLSQRIS